jgi:hypothetical protein
MLKYENNFTRLGGVKLQSTISPQKVYNKLKELPEEKLIEVWQFLEFMKFRDSQAPPERIIKLGGLLSEYKIDITEDDIAQARKEMWGNLGELNE